MCSCKTTLTALFLVFLSTAAVYAYTSTLTPFNGMDGTGASLNNNGDFGRTILADYAAESKEIKLENTSGTALHINLDSNPNASSDSNTAFNLQQANINTDPTAPAANGLLANHFLVLNYTVPEPSAILALATGLMGLFGLMSRKRPSTRQYFQ